MTSPPPRARAATPTSSGCSSPAPVWGNGRGVPGGGSTWGGGGGGGGTTGGGGGGGGSTSADADTMTGDAPITSAAAAIVEIRNFFT